MKNDTLKTAFTIIAIIAIAFLCYTIGNFLIAALTLSASLIVLLVVGLIKYGIPIAVIVILIIYLCKQGKKK